MLDINKLKEVSREMGYEVEEKDYYYTNRAAVNVYISYKNEGESEWFSLTINESVTNDTYSREVSLSACGNKGEREEILLKCFKSAVKLYTCSLVECTSEVTEEEIEKFFFG